MSDEARVRTLLHDYAREAPTPDSGSDLWDQGRTRRRNRLYAAVGGVVAATVLAVVAYAALDSSIATRPMPAGPPNPTPTVTRSETFTGMIIHRSSDSDHEVVAEDPTTGEAITLVDTAKFPAFRGHRISWAAPSPNGRWVAFELSFCQNGATERNATNGLWVTNGVDQPRQLTTACSGDGSDAADLWAWSPAGSSLVKVAGNDNDRGNQLILIDPATGDRTNLGRTAGGVTSMAWSPDGTRIAYATVPTGSGDDPQDGAVAVVSVNGGSHVQVAESLGGEVPGGEEGSGIAWSPDGTRIALVAEDTLYVMMSDGSTRLPLAEGVFIAHGEGSPNIVWSPDGRRITYGTFSPAHDQYEVWSVSANGSSPVLVFSPTSRPPLDTMVGGPIWSPDGTQIAFRYDIHSSQRSYLSANPDGTGNVHEIDELTYRGWRGGWYFCECYG
ncbi:MAG TPA: hypothetical protein VMT88_14175 [Actinomycetes bacterium]|nr:hypothetical protein [Actinomycetes bacterium]